MIDEFSKHEALDRAQLFADFFERQMCRHPFVEINPDLAARCDAIADQLGALYQEIGKK